MDKLRETAKCDFQNRQKVQFIQTFKTLTVGEEHEFSFV